MDEGRSEFQGNVSNDMLSMARAPTADLCLVVSLKRSKKRVEKKSASLVKCVEDLEARLKAP